MTAMPVAEPMTAEEFLALPDGEHRWTELVGGELVVDPPILGISSSAQRSSSS